MSRIVGNIIYTYEDVSTLSCRTICRLFSTFLHMSKIFEIIRKNLSVEKSATKTVPGVDRKVRKIDSQLLSGKVASIGFCCTSLKI